MSTGIILTFLSNTYSSLLIRTSNYKTQQKNSMLWNFTAIKNNSGYFREDIINHIPEFSYQSVSFMFLISISLAYNLIQYMWHSLTKWTEPKWTDRNRRAKLLISINESCNMLLMAAIRRKRWLSVAYLEYL